MPKDIITAQVIKKPNEDRSKIIEERTEEIKTCKVRLGAKALCRVLELFVYRGCPLLVILALPSVQTTMMSADELPDLLYPLPSYYSNILILKKKVKSLHKGGFVLKANTGPTSVLGNLVFLGLKLENI